MSPSRSGAPSTPAPAGIVLAAGAGRRIGGPKAMLVSPTGRPWVVRAAEVLLGAGVSPVVVVLGAAPEASALLRADGCPWSGLQGADVRSVVAPRWEAGLGASLQAGLAALAAEDSLCVLVTLVDLGDVGPEVVRRVLETTGADRRALGRAVYAGKPGHPVVLGRDHWEAAPNKRRELLEGPDAHRVECSDLATGDDLDHPDQIPSGTTRVPQAPTPPSTPSGGPTPDQPHVP